MTNMEKTMLRNELAAKGIAVYRFIANNNIKSSVKATVIKLEKAKSRLDDKEGIKIFIQNPNVIIPVDVVFNPKFPYDTNGFMKVISEVVADEISYRKFEATLENKTNQDINRHVSNIMSAIFGNLVK
jgi:hypothetical protein